jgi:hypothetical protein
MRNLVIVIATLAATPAHADRAKYSRKQNVIIDVKLSERVKPVQPTSAAPPKPIVTADALLEIEEHAQPIRRDQEAILEKLVRETPDDDPDKPDYMFVLAEHYAKQLRFSRLQANTPTVPSRPRH